MFKRNILPFDVIVFDLETNALPVETQEVRITEVGAVRLKPNLEIEDEFKSFVDGRPLTPRSIGITGITDEMLKDSQPWSVVGPQFTEWCRRSVKFILAAHGAYYDIPVLRWEYRRAGLNFPFPFKGLDVKSCIFYHSWTNGINIRSCGLQKTLERLKIEKEGVAHRALDDAKNSAKVLKYILENGSRHLIKG